MKIYLLILGFLISTIGFSQNNYIVKTDDGRRVLLKADYTWEYIDAEKQSPDTIIENTPSPEKSSECNLAEDFEEPKLDNKIQSQLKKGRATMSHVKKKVAKDYDCNVEDVLLLSVSEQKAKGLYHFCANGKKVSYKRNGHAIMESGKFF